MSWAKLDDAMPDHPKIIEAGPLAAWLYTCGLCYCARLITDGRIARKQVRKLADVEDPMSLASKLVEVGLWEISGDDFIVHDFLKYNPTRDQVLSTREARIEAGRIGGRASAEAKSKQFASGLLERPLNPLPSPPLPNPESPTHTPSLKVKDSAPVAKNATARPEQTELIEFFVSCGSKQEEADAFLDHFKSNGWLIGKAKAPMKDWQAAARGWIRRANAGTLPFLPNRRADRTWEDGVAEIAKETERLGIFDEQGNPRRVPERAKAVERPAVGEGPRRALSRGPAEPD